ncbi:MAG: hypothetical protein ACKOZY_06780, partial [Flavobacteriales bacterium]
AAEGLVAVASKEVGAGEVASAIEFNAETDFVARNDLFQNAAKRFAELGLEHATVEGLHGAELESGKMRRLKNRASPITTRKLSWPQ